MLWVVFRCKHGGWSIGPVLHHPRSLSSTNATRVVTSGKSTASSPGLTISWTPIYLTVDLPIIVHSPYIANVIQSVILVKSVWSEWSLVEKCPFSTADYLCVITVQQCTPTRPRTWLIKKKNEANKVKKSIQTFLYWNLIKSEWSLVERRPVYTAVFILNQPTLGHMLSLTLQPRSDVFIITTESNFH